VDDDLERALEVDGEHLLALRYRRHDDTGDEQF
jgi:hypothetical protein